MKITLITLNYNSAEKTIGLLESLKKQTDSDFSIVVADNGSGDVQQLQDYVAKLPNAHLIENKANLGFAGGNNPALRYAFKNASGTASPNETSWAVVLNPDTWVESDFIARLKTNLSFKEGLIGLPLKEGNKTAYAGRIDWFAPTLPHIHTRPYAEDLELYYPIGGGFAVSKKTYENLGGLDEEYFLYFEDADYALKTREAGIPVEFIHDPIIHHAVSAITSKLGSSLLLRYHYRNALHFNLKRGSMMTKVLVWPWGAFIIAKQLLKLMLGIHPSDSKAIIAGVVDFYQQKMGRIVTDKIRVGIECENLEDGQSRWGVGHLTLNLLQEYAKDPALRSRYELYLYFKNSIPNDEIFKNPIFNIRVLDFNSFNIFYHILMPLRAMWDRLDWMFFPAYMLPPLYIGKSVVMLTADVYHEYKNGKLPFRYRLAYWLFTNIAAEDATKILAISEASKKEIAHVYEISPEKIFVSHLGVETPPVSTGNIRGQYILYVGQMFPRRSAYESLLAFDKIAPEFPDLKFILVGKDKYQTPIIDQTIKNINQKLGAERILHYDYIASDADICKLYANAKLFVYVSSHEAFGLPPVEAAGYGVPVVVKDSEINHELFGNAAFFVCNPKDIGALAVTLSEALTNDAKRMEMIEQYKKIIPQLTWEKFTDRFFAQLHA